MTHKKSIYLYVSVHSNLRGGGGVCVKYLFGVHFLWCFSCSYFCFLCSLIFDITVSLSSWFDLTCVRREMWAGNLTPPFRPRFPLTHSCNFRLEHTTIFFFMSFRQTWKIICVRWDSRTWHADCPNHAQCKTPKIVCRTGVTNGSNLSNNFDFHWISIVKRLNGGSWLVYHKYTIWCSV